MKKLIYVLSIALFSLTFNLFSNEKSGSGKAILVKGSVYILEYQKGYKKSRLLINKLIAPQDIIQTDSNGITKIKMADGSSVTIKQNSRVQFSFVSKKSQRIVVGEGGLLTRVNKLTSQKGFSVVTPNSVAGVRGTKFTVEYNEKNKENKVDVYEGKVDYNQVDVSKTPKTVMVGGRSVSGYITSFDQKNESLNKGKAISSSKSGITVREADAETLKKYEALIQEESNISGWEFN